MLNSLRFMLHVKLSLLSLSLIKEPLSSDTCTMLLVFARIFSIVLPSFWQPEVGQVCSDELSYQTKGLTLFLFPFFSSRILSKSLLTPSTQNTTYGRRRAHSAFKEGSPTSSVPAGIDGRLKDCKNLRNPRPIVR